MNTDQILEFDQVRQKWKALALTRAAVEKIDSLDFYLDESRLRKNLRETDDARRFLEDCGTPPLASTDEAKELAAQAVKEGCLMPEQLERIEKMLAAVSRLKAYLNRGKQQENALAYYEQNLDELPDLREQIASQIRGGQVDDYASRQLLSLRSRMSALRDKMKQKAEQAVRSRKEYMADSYCTVRDGHICVPVKKEYRHKIAGMTIGQSSSGSTYFIEPAAVSKLQEEFQELQIGEENEVRRILYTLTALVADSAGPMEENIRYMEKLDYIFSKGKLSMELDAVTPRINTDRRIRLKDARHPLMEKERCVPLQFELGNGTNGIVITGPNTGGKTVAIKTVALNCLMAQCGLHVTCGEADICMNSSFLCDIGDGQNLTENLSTFSAHIKNVLEIMERLNSDSLVVMDELGSGTDPAEGMGIAVAILEELKNSGCLFLVTTHYPQVKEYAARAQTVQNARMEFDRSTLEPLYRMVIGEAGESCAFYIAKRLGMPARMLQNAACAAYGADAAGMRKQAWNPFGEDMEQAYGADAQKEDGHPRIRKARAPDGKTKAAGISGLLDKFQIGDSVMVLPDKKIGIVCEPVNEKGVLRVQLPGKKIWINHKRVRLHVKAAEMYPDDYDFSIVFDSAENRKKRHEMERRYTEQMIVSSDWCC